MTGNGTATVPSSGSAAAAAGAMDDGVEATLLALQQPAQRGPPRPPPMPHPAVSSSRAAPCHLVLLLRPFSSCRCSPASFHTPPPQIRRVLAPHRLVVLPHAAAADLLRPVESSPARGMAPCLPPAVVTTRGGRQRWQPNRLWPSRPGPTNDRSGR
ncbi:hypothetical protein ACP70R_041002 [Stipagrostis hirtigluma subsp. patula]